MAVHHAPQAATPLEGYEYSFPSSFFYNGITGACQWDDSQPTGRKCYLKEELFASLAANTPAVSGDWVASVLQPALDAVPDIKPVPDITLTVVGHIEEGVPGCDAYDATATNPDGCTPTCFEVSGANVEDETHENGFSLGCQAFDAPGAFGSLEMIGAELPDGVAVRARNIECTATGGMKDTWYSGTGCSGTAYTYAQLVASDPDWDKRGYYKAASVGLENNDCVLFEAGGSPGDERGWSALVQGVTGCAVSESTAVTPTKTSGAGVAAVAPVVVAASCLVALL
jgi:hypothetical protein